MIIEKRKADLFVAIGKAIASQGMGPRYSLRLEKTIQTLKKKLSQII